MLVNVIVDPWLLAADRQSRTRYLFFFEDPPVTRPSVLQHHLQVPGQAVSRGQETKSKKQDGHIHGKRARRWPYLLSVWRDKRGRRGVNGLVVFEFLK